MFSLIWMPFSIIRKSFHTPCHAFTTEPNPAFPMLQVVGPWMPSGIRQNHLTSHFSCSKAYAILWFDPLLPFFSHSISFSQPFFFPWNADRLFEQCRPLLLQVVMFVLFGDRWHLNVETQFHSACQWVWCTSFVWNRMCFLHVIWLQFRTILHIPFAWLLNLLIWIFKIKTEHAVPAQEQRYRFIEFFHDSRNAWGESKFQVFPGPVRNVSCKWSLNACLVKNKPNFKHANMFEIFNTFCTQSLMDQKIAISGVFVRQKVICRNCHNSACICFKNNHIIV